MVLYCWRLSLWVGGKAWVGTDVLINSKMAQWSELAFTALTIGNVMLHLMNKFFAGLFFFFWIWSNTGKFYMQVKLTRALCLLGTTPSRHMRKCRHILTSTLSSCEWSASRLCRFTHDWWAADTHWLRGCWALEPVGTFLRKDKLLSLQEI